MKPILTTRNILTILALLLFSAATAAGQPVRDRLLDDVTINKGSEYAAIKIDLSFPVRYVRHFPLDVGSEVRIQLEPLAISPQDRDALLGREAVTPREGNPASAAEVLYEGDVAGGPYLSVIFSQRVNYRVVQGSDYRSILVLVAIEQEQHASKMPKAADERTRLLQEEAERAMNEGNFSRAVQIYTKLSDDQEPAVKKPAQIHLAEARESAGQIAHAKAEYQRYLTLYPDGVDAELAKKRLADLRAGKKRTTSGWDDIGSVWQTDFYGGISQFYDRYATTTDLEGTVVDRSALDTNLDMTLRAQNDNYDFRAVVIGGHERDFRDEVDDEDRDEFRGSSLYLDFKDKRHDISARLGRQTKSSGGILGRFDGGVLRIPLIDKVAVNLVAGFPVASSRDGLQTDRYFYGINFDLGRFANHWDFNAFYIQQEVDGITDRRAVGGEVRYSYSRGSFFTLVDYDIYHGQLNTILSTGSLLLPDRTMLNLSFDYRQSPILTTSNALIGQTVVRDLDALRNIFTMQELKQLAEDRSAISKTVTFSVTHPLTEKLQIAGDVTWAKLEDTEASGGVEAFVGTDDEYFFSLQFIGSSLVKDGDLAAIGVRYSDTTRYDTYSGTLDTRYPIADGWKLNPEMVVDYREHKILNEEQWKFRPSLRIEYRPSRNLRFEIEGGYERTTDIFEDLEEDTEGTYIIVGYRWDF